MRHDRTHPDSGEILDPGIVPELQAEIERLQGVLETRENEIWSLKNELRDITIALDDELLEEAS